MTRLYNDNDYDMLCKMLTEEGIGESEMRFDRYDTFIVDNKGFFTLRREHGCLSVQHFCVGRKYRSAKVARELVKAMVDKVKEYGIKGLILHSKSNFVDKFIKHYFKKQPYAIDGITAYYYVEV
jgi:hypothetical protein